MINFLVDMLVITAAISVVAAIAGLILPDDDGVSGKISNAFSFAATAFVVGLTSSPLLVPVYRVIAGIVRWMGS